MRLLLVEDDVMVASGLKLGLSNAGYTVDWVGSAERAEQAVEKDSFDLAIVDIGLPGVNGMELTQRLRARGWSMPVLILTARDALHDRVQGLDLGADDYMLKPFELPELLARLGPCCGARRRPPRPCSAWVRWRWTRRSAASVSRGRPWSSVRASGRCSSTCCCRRPSRRRRTSCWRP